MEKTQSVKLNFLHMTPRKVRSVADTLRGLAVNEAEAQLMFQSRRASKPLLKLLRSAVAAAKAKQFDTDKMIISRIEVNQGPMRKSFLPRARGAATPLQKKMSHVTLVLTETDKVSKRFNIVIQKKVRLPEGEKKRKEPREKPEKEIKAKQEKTKPGFFQKVFRRKAGMGQ